MGVNRTLKAAILVPLLWGGLVDAQGVIYRLKEVEDTFQGEVIEGEYDLKTFEDLGFEAYIEDDKDEALRIGYKNQESGLIPYLVIIGKDGERDQYDLVIGEECEVFEENGEIIVEIKKEKLFEYTELEDDDEYKFEVVYGEQGVQFTFKGVKNLTVGEEELDEPETSEEVEVIEVTEATVTDTSEEVEVIEVTETTEETTEEETSVEVEIVEIEPETEYVEDGTMFVGEEEVMVEGVNGEKRITKTYLYVNGEQQGEPSIQEEIIKEPINKVVHKGTKEVVEEVRYEDIGFSEEVRETDDLIKGEKRTVQEGELGRKKVTIRTTKQKGEAVGDPEIIEEVEKEPVNKVIEVGTYENKETVKSVEEVEIPFEEERKESNDLAKGEEKVEVEGSVGIKRVTTEQDYINDVPVGESRTYEEVVAEPVNRVILVGTREDVYKEEIKREEEIPFKTNYKEDAGLYEGEEILNIEGQNGKKQITIITTYINGEQQGEPEIKEEILQQPIDQEIIKGTKTVNDIEINEREEEIDFKVEEYTDKRVKKGERHLVQKGEKGLKRIKEVYQLEKGERVGEPKVEEIVVKPAKPEVYLVGLKEEVKTTVKEETTTSVEKEDKNLIKTGFDVKQLLTIFAVTFCGGFIGGLYLARRSKTNKN